jgi:hypothetical protein
LPRCRRWSRTNAVDTARRGSAHAGGSGIRARSSRPACCSSCCARRCRRERRTCSSSASR